MSDIWTKEIPCRSIDGSSNANVIELRLYYNLGGLNEWTYSNEKRGYYLSVSPIEVRDKFHIYSCFSGTKKCLVECLRKGKKKEEEAVKAIPEWEKVLVDYVCKKNNLVLTEAA